MRRFLKSLAFVAYGVLLVAFLAGYAARFIRPGTFWWLQLLAIPLPYLSAIVVLSGLPLFLTRNWGLFGFNVGLMVLVAIRFWPAGGAVDASGFGVGETLSMMTLNYPSWSASDHEPRTRALLDLVNRERPDLIALQEGWSYYSPDGSNLHSRTDLSILVDSAAYLTHGPQRSDRSVSHVPLFSLFPLDVVNRFVLAPDVRGAGSEVTRAEATWRQHRITIYNLHLQSFGTDKPWSEDESSWLDPRTWFKYVRQYRDAITRRAGQAEQIAAMLRDETGPLIVMGDFNSTRHNWGFNRIAEGLHDTYGMAGSGRGSTYHARYPFARIDFILVSNHFAVLSAEVPTVVLSDHRPVLATVAWKERDEG